jgi:hypothetical protein
MKKLKSIICNSLSYFKRKKIKEPISKDLIKSKESSKFDCPNIENPVEDIYSRQVTSQPYIVKIENTTNKIIKDVCLFFGNNQNELAFNSDGNYVENGLVISSGVPNISYQQIVKNFIKNPFAIGLTYIQSINAKQVLEKFTFKFQDSNGNFFGKVITPIIDPYQQQTNIVAIKNSYFLDGNSSIVLNQVYPKTVLEIYFYPANKMFDVKFNDGKYYKNDDISRKLQILLQINDR